MTEEGALSLYDGSSFLARKDCSVPSPDEFVVHPGSREKTYTVAEASGFHAALFPEASSCC